MTKKYTIRLIFLAIAMGGVFLVLQSSSSPKAANKPVPAQETLDGSCKKESADKMIWENLSHQFFSSM